VVDGCLQAVEELGQAVRVAGVEDRGARRVELARLDRGFRGYAP
jgi:hypothetical protein